MPVLDGYLEHVTAAIVTGQWQMNSTRLVLQQWQQQTFRPIPLSVNQKLELARVDSLNAAAWRASYQGKFQDAVDYYQQALAIRKQHLGENHPETATSMNDVAYQLLPLEAYTVAMPLLLQALAIRERTLGIDHPQTVETLQHLATGFIGQGKYNAAEPLCFQVLTNWEHHFGANHPHFAAALTGLAILYHLQGKIAEAEPWFQQALSVYEQSQGPHHIGTAHLLNYLAINYTSQEKYTAALTYYLRALAIQEHISGPNHPDTAHCLAALAVLYYKQQQYHLAEPLLQRAMKIQVETLGLKHPTTARMLNNLAWVYRKQHLDTVAEPLFQQALAITEQNSGPNHLETVNSMNALAVLYKDMGRFADAEALLQRAIQGAEQSRLVLNDDHFARSQNHTQFRPYQNLTLLYLATHRPQQAWRTWEQSLGRGLFEELVIRQQRLITHEQKQRWQILKTQCQSYVKLLETAADELQKQEWQQLYFRHLNELAQLQRELAAPHDAFLIAAYDLPAIQAELLPHQAIVGWFDEGDEHYGFVVRVTGTPYGIRLPGQDTNGPWLPGELQLASQFVAQLAATLPTYQSESDRQTLQNFRNRLKQQRLGPLQPALAAHDGMPAATHLIVLPSVGMAGVPIEVLVDDQQLVHYATSGTVLAWLREQRRRRPQPNTAAGLLALGDPVFEATTISAFNKSGLGPKWGVVVEHVNAGSNAAKAGIKKDDVILTYQSTNVLQATDLVKALQVAQQQGLSEVTVKLWRPNRDRDEHGNDASDANSNGPGECSVTLSAGPLGVRIRPEPITHVAVPMAKQTVVRGANSDRWRATLERLEPLPGTRREVERLLGLARKHDLPATILLGSEANEQRLSQLAQSGELSQYQYLHFATHGQANDKFPLQSKLFLSRDQLPDPLAQIKSGQPVFRGELTATTILETWELNADLVVLSACQTGLGQFTQTEGYIGLAQPFLLAGAQSVLVSLWNVEDTATQLLMSRFYENLWGLRDSSSVQGKQPMNKIAALHEAKQWLRTVTYDVVEIALRQRGLALREALPKSQPNDQPFSHPHYWAAFILVGDWQ